MQLTAEVLQILRERESEATPGPWYASLEGGPHVIGEQRSTIIAGSINRPEDTSLIAAMRNHLPALLECAEIVQKLAETQDVFANFCYRIPVVFVTRNFRTRLTASGCAHALS